MSRRSPEEMADASALLLKVIAKRPAGMTKEQIKIVGFKTGLDAALRSLVRQRKVKKKGKTRAMVYTAK